MLISSPLDTICCNCKEVVSKGSRISYDKPNHRISHALCSEEGKEADKHIQLSKAISSDIDYPIPAGLSYKPFQKAGIHFALQRIGTLIADEMGLGKTIQAIGVLNSTEWETVCIICPESLRINWQIELNKWAISYRQKKNKIIIANYDNLKIVPFWEFDYLILDEAQYCKNPTSKRTLAVKDIASRSKKKIALSGTPIENFPVELWPLLQIIAPDVFDPPGVYKGQKVGAGQNAGFFRFAKRYCDAKEKIISTYVHPVTKEKFHKKIWDVKGSSNLPELQEKLRSTIMIRRLKKDVLKELPPKQRQIILLPVNATKDGELIDWPDQLENLPNSLEECLALVKRDLPSFNEFSRVRHEQGLKKLPQAIPLIETALESSEKIIVFTYHIDVAKSIKDALEKYFPAFITGDEDGAERNTQVFRFQSHPKCRVIIGTISAMGVGLTLTASSHVIFVEGNYNPSKVMQAEDRPHRIGQLKSVLIQYILQAGTLDTHMMQLVVEKMNVIDLALDKNTLE